MSDRSFQTLPHAPGSGRPGARLRASLRSLAAAILTATFALRPLAVGLVTLGNRTAMTRSGARTMAALARVLCPLFGIRVTVVGAPPRGPCVVAPNHLSYIDILVLAAAYDGVFVSRADVRGWPGIGPLSRLGGTIYVDRARKRDAARAGGEIGDALARGLRVTVFLEGRAGDGSALLPFRSSLLEPACESATPCCAAALSFALPEDPAATVARDVAWADDTPFGAHAFRLLGLRRIEARVVFGPVRSGPDRKALAALLEQDCAAALATNPNRAAPVTARGGGDVVLP